MRLTPAYAMLNLIEEAAERFMMAEREQRHPIIVYVIERHPLDLPETGPLFQWLQLDRNLQQVLEGLLGPFDPDQMTILVDKEPGGEAWEQLMDGLLAEKIDKVVTHLAPLRSAQRQQLIGTCAEMGAQLITPSDAGRNRH